SYRTVPPGGKATLTFVEEKVADAQECAVFSIEAKIPLLGEAQAGSKVSIELTGELTVTKRQCLLLYAICEGTVSDPEEKRDSVKDEKESRKGALAKETWTYYVKFG